MPDNSLKVIKRMAHVHDPVRNRAHAHVDEPVEAKVVLKKVKKDKKAKSED